ncbi:SPR [Drosophila busckii]|uniref:SPR n=1 Tax=Drosophila busckii TaxID=30019 RepID=A0A0M4EMH0_DROBS|nr:sex peptide receptor [Drosophila busckii]ALC48934.1 SPR [Drosophila busckii]
MQLQLEVLPNKSKSQQQRLQLNTCALFFTLPLSLSFHLFVRCDANQHSECQLSTAAMDNNSVYSYGISAANVLYQWGGGASSGSDGDAAAHTIDMHTLPSSVVGESRPRELNGTRAGNESSSGGGGGGFDYATHQQLISYECPPIFENISYLNVTCDLPLDYALPLYGYCMPFLLVLTIISNSLIVLVLSKKSMATPTNFVLMGMAITDLLTVLFPAPGLIYMYTFGNHYKPMHPVSMCHAFSIFNEIMPVMCHTISVWLTLALAVQRYIYVCHAPMARTWCTMPRVKRCTFYIVLLAFLHQLPRFFDRTYLPMYIEWHGNETEVCHLETSEWVDDYVGVDLYYTSYFTFRVLFCNLLPCVVLVTLNILLFAALRQAQERRKLLFRENRKKECKKLRDSNCTTLMLIVVVTVFLIAEIPIAVVTSMHIVSSLIIKFLDYRIANIFIVLTNFFLVLSYPINFGIYCGMSRQFRETFKEIFLGRMANKKDSSSKYSIVNGPRTCTNTNETVL